MPSLCGNFGCRIRITLLMSHRGTHRRRGRKSNAIRLFDVFRVAKSGREVRLASLPTLEGAKARVAALGAAKPGEYFVFNQLSLLNESIKVERH
jgi:hypothetical protein